MRVFEVKRELGNGVSVTYYYYLWAVLNQLAPAYRESSLVMPTDRAEFWKLQGDILGSMVGEK